MNALLTAKLHSVSIVFVYNSNRVATNMEVEASSRSINWHAVAAQIHGRSNKDCRKRWHYTIAANTTKGTWSHSEDERLYASVRNRGKKWVLVAKDVGSRNGDQCSKRWNSILDPDIDHSPWMSDDVCPQRSVLSC